MLNFIFSIVIIGIVLMAGVLIATMADSMLKDSFGLQVSPLGHIVIWIKAKYNKKREEKVKALTIRDLTEKIQKLEDRLNEKEEETI